MRSWIMVRHAVALALALSILACMCLTFAACGKEKGAEELEGSSSSGYPTADDPTVSDEVKARMMERGPGAKGAGTMKGGPGAPPAGGAEGN